MDFSFEETPESRTQQSGDSENHELIYKAAGEFDDYNVHGYAYSLTPLTVARPTGILYRTSVNVTPDGFKQYIVRVSYGKKGKSVGTIGFSFDTTGATVNIKCAKSHVASYPDDGDWHKGAINVKKDGEVEGADIIIPALKMTYTFKHPAGVITEDFARSIAGVTGTTNSGEFRGFQIGELLFAGASGSDGTDADAECAYQFIASQNATGLTVGGIASIAKAGHDYAWVEFDDDIHDGESVQRAKRVHVELVYYQTDFASAFGWS